MSLREQWNYLLHVARLVRHSPVDYRFYLFCIIGFAGMLVNMVALAVFVNIFQVEGMMASVGASGVGMMHNFVLNDRFTWKIRKKPGILRRLLQLFQFISICSFGVFITALIAQGFLSLGWSIYVGQLAGIVTATFWNYSANNQWTWSDVESDGAVNPKLTVTQEYSREIY